MRLIDADALIEKLEAWKKEAERRDANINYTFASAIIAQVNAEPTIEERKWIPVSERLPEKARFYICTMKDSLVLSVWYSRFFGFEKEDVIAWMPLPEPYKEDNT